MEIHQIKRNINIVVFHKENLVYPVVFFKRVNALKKQDNVVHLMDFDKQKECKVFVDLTFVKLIQFIKKNCDLSVHVRERSGGFKGT